jgi:hypothetical protein
LDRTVVTARIGKYFINPALAGPCKTSSSRAETFRPSLALMNFRPRR